MRATSRYPSGPSMPSPSSTTLQPRLKSAPPSILVRVVPRFHFSPLTFFSGTIPVHVPQGTPPPATGDLLEDVKMAENGRVNGHDDISMSDDTPAATPGISTDFSKTNLDGATSQVRSYPDEHDDEEEPPAKRARMHSEGEAMSQHVCIRPFMHGVLIVFSRPSLHRRRRPPCPARPALARSPLHSRPVLERPLAFPQTQTLLCPFRNGVSVIRLCVDSRNTRMWAHSCALSTLSP